MIRRNGAVIAFDSTKISVAMTKAFLAVEGDAAAASRRVHERVETLTAQVVAAVTRRLGEGAACHIEDIQDQVELALMRAGEHKVARAYIVYRDARAQARARVRPRPSAPARPVLRVTTPAGDSVPLDTGGSSGSCGRRAPACRTSRPSRSSRRPCAALFDGIPQADVAAALIMSARPLIEREPGYSYVTARLLLDVLRREALSFVAKAPREATQAEAAALYPSYFREFVKTGVALELLDPRLAEFDLECLGAALEPAP